MYLTISSVTVRIRKKKYIIPNRTLNSWQEISTTFDKKKKKQNVQCYITNGKSSQEIKNYP